ncbi:hypothetical protein ScalyP_jg9301 [Parmales sp. scaly parma]|nr:hypothetical protein ScalyP_jg9301 [Parmales sp. scaly parma]
MAQNDNHFFTESRQFSPKRSPKRDFHSHSYSSINKENAAQQQPPQSSTMDLFNLSSADRVIKSLLDTVAIQGQQIKQLQIQSQTLAGQNLVKASVDDLTRQILNLSDKVSAIEDDISLQPPTHPNSNSSNSNKLGPMTLANRRAIASLSSVLTTKASTQALEQTLATIKTDEEILSKINSRDFVSLKKAVESVEEYSKRLAGQGQLDEVTKILIQHDKRFDEVDLAFEGGREQQQYLFSNVNKKIDAREHDMVKNINTRVTKPEWNRALVNIRNELGAKAWDTKLNDLGTFVEDLSLDYEKTRVKADLSSRFVKWFGDRGEMYENNLNAVDGHLRNLAVSAHTSLKK